MIENTFKKGVKKFGKGDIIGLSLHPQSGTADWSSGGDGGGWWIDIQCLRLSKKSSFSDMQKRKTINFQKNSYDDLEVHKKRVNLHPLSTRERLISACKTCLT